MHGNPLNATLEQLIFYRYKNRESLKKIGRRFGVSGECIRWTLAKHGYKPEPKDDLFRFYKRFEKGPDDKCWIWRGTLAKTGYGVLQFRNRQWKAHRIAFLLHYGAIDDKKIVMHHCDNPICVNPHHLRLGSHADNVRDMCAKGRARHLHGTQLPQTRLRENDVRFIRKNYYILGLKKLAEKFGVNEFTVYCAHRRRTWKHIK